MNGPLSFSLARYFFVLVLVAVTAVSSATTITLTAANELYRAAHLSYQKQDFFDARSKYLAIADAGFKSQDLFYNLGTVSARLGRRGEAILYLEKAREVGPRDQDVLANLKKVAPVANPLTGAGPSEPVRWLTGSLSLDSWALVFLACLTLACLLGAWRLLRASRPAASLVRLGAWTFTFLALLSGGLTWLKYYQQEMVENAVVMVPAATLRSGPAEKFTQIETLPEGTLVRRLNIPAEGWSQVQLGDGRKGYLPNPELEVI